MLLCGVCCLTSVPGTLAFRRKPCMGKTRDEMLVLMVCVYEGEHASAPLPLVVMQGGEESREARGAIECLVAAHGHEQGGKEKEGGPQSVKVVFRRCRLDLSLRLCR